MGITWKFYIFTNTNIHGLNSQFWSLGLAQIIGSLPAENYIELLEKKLKVDCLDLYNNIKDKFSENDSVEEKKIEADLLDYNDGNKRQ